MVVRQIHSKKDETRRQILSIVQELETEVVALCMAARVKEQLVADLRMQSAASRKDAARHLQDYNKSRALIGYII